MRRVKITGASGFAPSVNIILKPDITNPRVLQEIASSGLARKYFTPGDEVTIPWTNYSGDEPVAYQYPFIVVDIADVQDQNDTVHHDALWLMAKYVVPNISMPFDAAEREIETNTVFEEGKYYYAQNGMNYKYVETIPGEAIPDGETYYYNCDEYMGDAVYSGYSNWEHSAIRQWLNSDAAKNAGWWKAQHLGDSAPTETYTNKPGWMYGFAPEWKNIFKPVRVETMTRNKPDRYKDDIIVTYDRFFLPSLEQLYLEDEKPGLEGKYWPYWKEVTGYDEPTKPIYNTPNQNIIIKTFNNSSVKTALRSQSRTQVYNTESGKYVNIMDNGDYYYITLDGYINTNPSSGESMHYNPCCVIY